MATDEHDLIEAVVTCEGNLYDPDFPIKFGKLADELKSALYISKTKDPFRVRKIEPWNSVRVTIVIPKEAAQKLKLLAQQGSNVLRSMGILSVQVEGDEVISLTLANQNNESTQVIIRQSNDEIASTSGTSGVSSSSLPASSPSLSSISSSVASISSPIPLTPSSAEGTGISASLDMFSSSPSSSAFRSPNVVAPSGEALPVLPPKTPTTGIRPALGGPFPFVSMTHAAQAIHRNEQGSSSVVISSSNSSSSSNKGNSTNNAIPSTAPLLQGVQSLGVLKPLQSPKVHVSNNPPTSFGAPVIVSTSAVNVVRSVNVNSESNVTRLIIDNPSGLSSAQLVSSNVAGLGISGSSNLAISQAGPSQSLQLQLVNVPPPYTGVNTVSSNINSSSSSSDPVGTANIVQVRLSQQQSSSKCSPAPCSSNTNLPTATMVSPIAGDVNSITERTGFLSEGLSVAPSNISDSTSGVSILSQPVSSPLLVNLLQNSDVMPGPSNSSPNPDTYNQELQRLKKTQTGLNMDGACSSVPKHVPAFSAASGSDSVHTTAPSSSIPTDSFQFAFPLPSENNSKMSVTKVSIPSATQNMPNQKLVEPTTVVHNRTIVQGNIRILDQNSGQLRTIPLHQNPPPYLPTPTSPLTPAQGRIILPGAVTLQCTTTPSSENITTLTNGPILTTSLSLPTDVNQSKPHKNVAAVTTVEQRSDHQPIPDLATIKSTPLLAVDQSRTLLPVTAVNVVSNNSASKSSSIVNFNSSKDSDSKTFIPPPDPRLSSQVPKVSSSGNPISVKNSSDLIVQNAIYNTDAKSSTSQLSSIGRTVLTNKRSPKDRTFPINQQPTGKPRQFLINPLTGHLEPMPNESSSESEEGDESIGDGEGARKGISNRSNKVKPVKGSNSPFHHRQIVTTDTGVTVARVVKGSHLPDLHPAQLQKKTEGRKLVIPTNSETNTFSTSGVSGTFSTRKIREDSATSAALHNQKDIKDGNIPGPATVTATSVSGEKIKLRLKLEKSEPISPAYKVDVSFVKKSEKSSMQQQNVSPTTSVSGISSLTTFPLSSGSQINCGEQPRVPPLHISLRGKNAAVVVSPRREEKDNMPPPPPIASIGDTKDLSVNATIKDGNILETPSGSFTGEIAKKLPHRHLPNFYDEISKSSSNIKRVKNRVKTQDMLKVGNPSKTSIKLKPKVSRPKLNNESITMQQNVADNNQPSATTMPVLQPAVVVPTSIIEKVPETLSYPVTGPVNLLEPHMEDSTSNNNKEPQVDDTPFIKEEPFTYTNNCSVNVSPSIPLIPETTTEEDKTKDMQMELDKFTKESDPMDVGEPSSEPPVVLGNPQSPIALDVQAALLPKLDIVEPTLVIENKEGAFIKTPELSKSTSDEKLEFNTELAGKTKSITCKFEAPTSSNEDLDHSKRLDFDVQSLATSNKDNEIAKTEKNVITTLAGSCDIVVDNVKQNLNEEKDVTVDAINEGETIASGAISSYEEDQTKESNIDKSLITEVKVQKSEEICGSKISISTDDCDISVNTDTKMNQEVSDVSSATDDPIKIVEEDPQPEKMYSPEDNDIISVVPEKAVAISEDKEDKDNNDSHVDIVNVQKMVEEQLNDIQTMEVIVEQESCQKNSDTCCKEVVTVCNVQLAEEQDMSASEVSNDFNESNDFLSTSTQVSISKLPVEAKPEGLNSTLVDNDSAHINNKNRDVNVSMELKLETSAEASGNSDGTLVKQVSPTSPETSDKKVVESIDESKSDLLLDHLPNTTDSILEPLPEISQNTDDSESECLPETLAEHSESDAETKSESCASKLSNDHQDEMNSDTFVIITKKSVESLILLETDSSDVAHSSQFLTEKMKVPPMSNQVEESSKKDTGIKEIENKIENKSDSLPVNTDNGSNDDNSKNHDDKPTTLTKLENKVIVERSEKDAMNSKAHLETMEKADVITKVKVVEQNKNIKEQLVSAPESFESKQKTTLDTEVVNIEAKVELEPAALNPIEQFTKAATTHLVSCTTTPRTIIPPISPKKAAVQPSQQKSTSEQASSTVNVTIVTPKKSDAPAVIANNTPPISIVLPSETVRSSNPEGKTGGASKTTYKRRAEIKPGALQNTLKRLHDNFLPKVLKTSDKQDVSTSHNPGVTSTVADSKTESTVPVSVVEPMKVSIPHSNAISPPNTIITSKVAPLSQSQTVGIAVQQVRPMSNVVQRSKPQNSKLPISTHPPVVQSTYQQISTGLPPTLLANVTAGIPSTTLSTMASLSVTSSTSGTTPQTVFAIHPNVSIPANFAQLQQSPVVLPGGHKMVPIKLVTLPKQTGSQIQTIPLGNTTSSRSSPNLLEAVNIVANAGSRSSSPKTTLIGNTMQSTPLNLSSMSLPVGGNLHFVPISVSSGSGGGTSNVKVLMTQPIKMQQAGLSQSMVVKSVIMGSQPTTIRVIRPTNLQEPISIQTLMKPTVVEESNMSDRSKPEVKHPVKSTTTFKLDITGPSESIFKKLDGVEIVETGSPLNNDDLPFEADIIHDEKDLADVLAAEAKNSTSEAIIVENCSTFSVSTKPNKTLEKVSQQDVIASAINHVASRNFLSVSRDKKWETKLITSTSKSAKSNSSSRSTSPLSPSVPDLHGEDPEIINSFSGNTARGKSKVVPSKEEKVITGVDALPDHTYGVNANCGAELSIEIPPIDMDVSATASPSQNHEEKRCTRSTRSNTRLSPDITAFVSETQKPAKLSVKVDTANIRNSPKPSPTGSLKGLSPTPSSLTITPSTSTRSSPILHSQHQVNANNAAATINAVAMGIIDKIQGCSNVNVSVPIPSQNVKNSRLSRLTGSNKRKRQESDSSSASKDENNEEKAEIDLNSRPGKRKCSENAAEMIKVCIGVEDSPKRNAMTVKKTDESKLKESKGKKGLANIDEDDDADSEVSLTRGRSRSSRESSEDRSSSRGSSVHRVISTTSDKQKVVKDEEVSKDTNTPKTSRFTGRLKDGGQKPKSQTESTTPAKKAKDSSKTTSRKPNRPNSKHKSPLTPAKTRTNVRKDGVATHLNSDKTTGTSPSTNAATETENARRKTRSSVAGKSHVTHHHC